MYKKIDVNDFIGEFENIDLNHFSKVDLEMGKTKFTEEGLKTLYELLLDTEEETTIGELELNIEDICHRYTEHTILDGARLNDYTDDQKRTPQEYLEDGGWVRVFGDRVVVDNHLASFGDY
jgi:hypothetical protein